LAAPFPAFSLPCNILCTDIIISLANAGTPTQITQYLQSKINYIGKSEKSDFPAAIHCVARH
jgi:hypothetical protein